MLSAICKGSDCETNSPFATTLLHPCATYAKCAVAFCKIARFRAPVSGKSHLLIQVSQTYSQEACGSWRGPPGASILDAGKNERIPWLLQSFYLVVILSIFS